MAEKKLSPAVEQVIREWLVDRSDLFNTIIEEIAEEIAPLVASQALEQLNGAIWRTPTAELLLQMVEACQAALNILGHVERCEMEECELHIEDVSEQLDKAIQAAIAHVPTTPMSDKPASLPSGNPWIVEEGGAS